jgi:hypothetical protein
MECGTTKDKSTCEVPTSCSQSAPRIGIILRGPSAFRLRNNVNSHALACRLLGTFSSCNPETNDVNHQNLQRALPVLNPCHTRDFKMDAFKGFGKSLTYDDPL